MHELSLCEAIARTVTERADGRSVRRVGLRVGQFRQVVPESLRFYWDMQTRGGDLDGSVLEIEHVPTVLRCRSCAARTPLDVPVLLCGSCDGVDVELESGDELLIVAIDVVRDSR